MRLTTVIIIASLMQVSASSLAQKVTLNEKGSSLRTVLQKLRTQTGFDFIFDAKHIENAHKVNVNIKGEDLTAVLDEIFENQNITYTIKERSIILKPKEPSFLGRLAERWASIDVSGRVVDADGRGLPGASVSVKGKGGKAVSTGTNGSFYLKGVDEDAVLVVSFIGYVSREIKAAKELGDVVLELSTSKLDEVQVIAYGTTTQRLSTGNVTTIKADVIEKQPVNNPLLALQGRVSGLFIEQATGFAGTGVKVRIQGQNSLNNGSDPLYVIDGVPYISQLLPGGNGVLGQSGGTDGSVYGNPMSFINPSDIESIDILKDADATAIYGSRAANGAILITTKKGKTGDVNVNMNLQSGWGKVPHKLDLLNSAQYLEIRREALNNDGITNPVSGAYGDSDLNGNWDNTRNTDWQKELIGGTAGYQDLNASVSGGSDRTTFLIGAGYHRETSVFPGDFADQKASVHFNINSTSNNQKFKLQFSGSYLFDNNEMPNRDLTSEAIRLAPVAPNLYRADGSINWEPDALGNSTFIVNPIGYTKNSFLNNSNNLTGNMLLSYQILSGLSLKTSLGINKLTSDITNKFRLDAYPPEIKKYIPRGTIFGNGETNSWIIEPQLTYGRNVLGGKLEILLGTTFQKNNSKYSDIQASGFSNDLVMDDILSATTLTPNSSGSSVYKYNAFFGRINYNWDDKYILNLTGRRDGSSRFGPKSQFHNFAAIGLAWIFSNEKFIKDNLSYMSFGKVRGSYGTTGSDQIGDYKILSLYTPLPQDKPYQGIPIYIPNGLNNPYLQWEETKKLQFGIDLGFFKDKLLLNANYYSNHSSNQLSSYSLPWTTGFTGITRNQTYKIQNSGWELLVTASILNLSKFNWKASVNLTVPKSLLVDYPDIVKSTAASIAIIGQPLSSVRVYRFLRVDPLTGAFQFADKNGIQTNSPKDPDDKTVIVDTAPKFYGGLQNSFSYKGFQLDVLFSFVKQDALNYSFGAIPGNFESGMGNQPASILKRWRQSGDVATYQKFSTATDLVQAQNDFLNSDASFKDASYVRLKNVSLSWTLPNSLVKLARLKSGALLIQGQNLLTSTNYTGLDPESKSSTTLPPLRVITMGIKIGL